MTWDREVYYGLQISEQIKNGKLDKITYNPITTWLILIL